MKSVSEQKVCLFNPEMPMLS